jgi:ABC-2 type transport system ATP-binding protein
LLTQTLDPSSLLKLERNNAVSIRGLSKSFGTFRALHNVNLDIEEGEIFGLLGPNGAGKTTTMRILSCLIRPGSGSVFVEGMSVLDKEKTVEIRKKIGLLTENPNIYERLTAEQNLRFFALAYGLKEELADQRITEILRGFDLLSRRDRKAGTFSKGMKQKLAIARALIHKPSLLLLDEPTSALDAESARSIRELILETAKNYKHTVLLSTHNLDEASKLCDRIAILNKGEIMVQGTENEIAAAVRSAGGQLLGNSLEPVRLRIEMMETGAFSVPKLLANVSGISDVCPYMNSHYGFEFSIDPKLSEFEIDLLISKIVSFVIGLGGEITLVQPIKPALEDIYMRIVSMSKEARAN